jgi:hypothetical protein
MQPSVIWRSFVAKCISLRNPWVGQEIKRGVEAVVRILLAPFFPHMRNLGDFWAVGGLLDQADVALDEQLSGAIPPSIPLPASR